jgi:hypothetical protein
MDKHLEHLIRQALEDAGARGKDYITQTALAVGTVLAHETMTASDALAKVKMVRQSMFPQGEQYCGSGRL